MAEMTKRERIKAALGGENVDRVRRVLEALAGR